MPAANRARPAIRIALQGLALLHLAVLAWVVAQRIGYPFGLEWMEGGAISHVERILAGRGLYVEPSIEFLPFIYPPLYFWLATAVSMVFGVGLFSLRLVSVLAAVGSLVVLFLYVRRETGSGFWGLISAALFAACYERAGAWLDLARVDSLFLLFLLLAIFFLRGPATPGRRLASGICLTLSFLTKQSALIAAAPLVLWSLWYDRKRSVWFVASGVGLIGLTTLLANLLTDGWYTYYLWLPGEHGILRHVLLTFWTQDLLLTLPVAVALSVWFVSSRRNREVEGLLAFYVLLAVGILATVWISRLHPGGYANVLLPAYALIAVLAGLGGAGVVKALPDGWGERRTWAESGLYLVLLMQFAWLLYDPRPLIPTAEDTRQGELLVERIAGIQGEVLVPFHAYLAERAGKQGYALGNVGGDIFRSGDESVAEPLAEEMRRAIREQRFAAIVLDNSVLNSFTRFLPLYSEELEQAYRPGGKVFDRDDVFWPTTGARTRPEWVFVPVEGASP